jgi:hypothetical protein
MTGTSWDPGALLYAELLAAHMVWRRTAAPAADAFDLPWPVLRELYPDSAAELEDLAEEAEEQACWEGTWLP